MVPSHRVEQHWTSFVAAVRAPIAAMRWAYLPPMMVYFAAGLAITSVASQFWIKKDTTLSPADLAGLAVWLGLPAIMKMVFGELIDTVRLLGSNRRVYIFIGAAMIAVADLLLAGSAAGVITSIHPNKIYVITALLGGIAYILQDVAADAMTTEVVPQTHDDGTPRSKEDIDRDLTMVQVLGRLFLMAGGLSTAYLGGWLAQRYSYATVFLIGLIAPLISISGAWLIKTDTVETRPTDWTILGGGLALGAFVLALGLLEVPFGQEITLVASLAIICTMLYRISGDMPAETRTRIFYAALIIFCFRAYPNTGDGTRWFLIDRYGFDEQFFGALDTIGSLAALVTAWLLAGIISRTRVTSVLLMLTVISTVLALPGLLLIFEGAMKAVTAATGIGPRSVAMVDTAAQSPIMNLSMIPMLALIAVNAPPKWRALWFSLMASFMNVALSAGDLMTKYMNMIFVIDRGKYEQLPALTVWVLLITVVIPVAAILLWRKRVD
jgi:MFS family permease